MTPVGVMNIDDWKDRLSWHFGSFCKNGLLTQENLFDDLRARKRQCWVVLDGEKVAAAILTTVANDCTNSVIVTHAAGKNRKAWVHLWAHIEGWAKSIGSTRIEAVARLGWESDLKRLGLKKTHIVMERGL